MAGKTTITLPLLRLGRLQLDHGLRALPVGPAASGPVVTATVSVPDTPADRSYEWDVAWADAARQASQLGADQGIDHARFADVTWSAPLIAGVLSSLVNSLSFRLRDLGAP